MKCFIDCQNLTLSGGKTRERGREIGKHWESIREDVNLRNGRIKGLGRRGLRERRGRRDAGRRQLSGGEKCRMPCVPYRDCNRVLLWAQKMEGGPRLNGTIGGEQLQILTPTSFLTAQPSARLQLSSDGRALFFPYSHQPSMDEPPSPIFPHSVLPSTDETPSPSSTDEPPSLLLKSRIPRKTMIVDPNL